jgi:hypothetical protein
MSKQIEPNDDKPANGSAPAEAQAIRWTKRLVPELTCLRCEYEWLPRNPDHIPKKCPKCLTKLWNVPRTYQLPGKPKPSRKRGAPSTAEKK